MHNAFIDSRKRIECKIRDIEFILSDATTDQRIAYFLDLAAERKELFAWYLLYTKDDLIAYKERLATDYFAIDEFTAYQEELYLRPQAEMEDEQ